MSKLLYYDLSPILSQNAHYSVIFGERSNGKSWALKKYGLDRYIDSGEQFAIIRRYEEDFKTKRGQSYFDDIVDSGYISKRTKGKWTHVLFYTQRWFFCRYEGDDKEKKRVVAETPFAYAFSLNSMEHDKSSSYPNVTTIVFEEFLTRGSYLYDEFALFTNILSTIIRQRDNVRVFMLGNTVNKYCPYFAEMGLNRIKSMKQGDIDIYKYGESALKVAVEYADSPNKKGKPSDVYFAFGSPKLDMIKTGIWEMNIYPHLPEKYIPKEVTFSYFIKFDNEMLQCEIIEKENGNIFTFVHRKTSQIKNDSRDLVYSTEYNPRPNFRRNILKPSFPFEKKISWFFINDKVFYQDNEIGEIMRNYILWCSKNSMIK